MLNTYFCHYVDRYSPYKGGPVCYEDGLLYFALIRLFQASGNKAWIEKLIPFVEAQIAPDGTLKDYVLEEYNIDNILSGRAFLYLAKETDDPRYRKAIDTMALQLSSHPRTQSGNYWHKKRYPHQVWLDGLWMGLPFQIEYAQLVGNDDLLNDAIDQILRALDLLYVPSTGLYAHGYDEAREQPWANKETGHNEAHWARAIGWLAIALADICDLIKAPADGKLVQRLTALLDRVVELQCTSGAWLQVIDQPDLPGNYEESSASAMFSYALMKTSRLGYGDQYAAAGLKALKQLEKLVAASEGDHAVLTGICCVAGLGGFEGNYRDGTAHYYTTETLKDDDIKGVSPLMMAYSESLLMTSE